jgi:hypothetical protein
MSARPRTARPAIYISLNLVPVHFDELCRRVLEGERMPMQLDLRLPAIKGQLKKKSKHSNDLVLSKGGYTFGVRTHRPGGNYHEAFSVVWRPDRVALQGLVGSVWDRKEVYRNDPYVVSFRRGQFDFTLLLLHTRWTDDADGTRAGEVRELADQIQWLRTFLSEKDIMVAGDFNYSGSAQQMRSFATDASMIQVDPNVPSTFKAHFSGYGSSYDHIYISEQDTFEYSANTSDVLDTTVLVYGSRSLANMTRSKGELSDHLPVFAVFTVTGPDDD